MDQNVCHVWKLDLKFIMLIEMEIRLELYFQVEIEIPKVNL